MKFMACSCVLAWAVLSGLPGAVLAADYPKEVECRKGAYDIGGQRIRFFAFTYQGKLSRHTIERETRKVVKGLRKNNTSAVHQRTPSSGFPHPWPLRLPRGTVFVIGWTYAAQDFRGWLAVDTDGQPSSRHRWLASDAAAGTLDSGQAWVEPQRATAYRSWSVTDRRDAVVVLQMDATRGWLHWYMDWDER